MKSKREHFIDVIKTRIGDKVPITEPIFKNNVKVDYTTEGPLFPVDIVEGYRVTLEARFYGTTVIEKDALTQAREDADTYLNYKKEQLAHMMVRELYGDVQNQLVELLMEMNKRYIDRDIQRKVEDILESIS